LFDLYAQEVQFVVVYISEAHAFDGVSPNTARNAPLVEEPITFEERFAVAGKCMVSLSLQRLPAVVDGIDNQVNRNYQAQPDRMYLVGKDGKIAYAGGRGPRGFKPKELQKAIRKELGLEVLNPQAKVVEAPQAEQE